MHIEWRREDPSATAADDPDAHVAALEERLRNEIALVGPVTFARFMERALYEPDHGYYAVAASRPTRAGDFLTAPELHPIFGRTLAAQIDEMWRRLGEPGDIVMREYGAGSGALFLAIADGLDRAGSPLASALRYDPIDFARQRESIRVNVAAAGRDAQLIKVADDHSLANAIVVANEFLDALPVHRVVMLNGELREIYVAWHEDRFTEVAGPLSDERLASWLPDAGTTLAELQRAEVNLQLLDWVDRLGAEMERGYAIVIDYGAAARELYDATLRPTGTIRAFAAHRVSGDVLSRPGSRDMTSHVDFDALERRARACGFEVAGRRKSNEFLLAAGLNEVYAQARAQTADDWDASLNLRSAIQRLLDPAALGGYLVTVLAKDAPAQPPLLGLQPLTPTR